MAEDLALSDREQVALPLADNGAATVDQADTLPPHSPGVVRRIFVRAAPLVAAVFLGGFIGLYFQPPGLQSVFEITGLQPGGGTDTPIAEAIETVREQTELSVISQGDMVALGRVIPRDDVITLGLPFGAADLAYQTTERPTGVIFGFGVIIGIVVGLVIVYQVLSTDVADHLKEYATFKAIGYAQGFFLGIVLEEAIVLAVLGFLPGVVISTALYAAMSSATGLPLAMSLPVALAVLIGTILACAISGALATRRLAGADPADLF